MSRDDVSARRTSRRRRPGRARLRDFYASALAEAEQVVLADAVELEGIDQEIAVLRTKLRAALAEHPEDIALMLRGIDLLVKAVVAKYRLSPSAGKDLSDNIAGVVQGVGELLAPEAFADG